MLFQFRRKRVNRHLGESTFFHRPKITTKTEWQKQHWQIIITGLRLNILEFETEAQLNGALLECTYSFSLSQKQCKKWMDFRKESSYNSLQKFYEYDCRTSLVHMHRSSIIENLYHLCVVEPDEQEFICQKIFFNVSNYLYHKDSLSDKDAHRFLLIVNSVVWYYISKNEV